MKIIAYIRVSTDKQAELGLGLDVQRQAIAAWARQHGHMITAWHSDEGISGSDGLDRQVGLAEAFRTLERGDANALVIHRMDRLANKLASQLAWTEQLERSGCRVISVTEPDIGADEVRTLVRQVLGAVAEYNRALIVRNTQAGRALKHERGGFAYGSPSYGWKAEGRELVPVPAEQAVLARMRQLHEDGVSWAAIAAQLNAEGIPAKQGGRWHGKTIQRLIDPVARQAARASSARQRQQKRRAA